jgi:hypothetical protein
MIAAVIAFFARPPGSYLGLALALLLLLWGIHLHGYAAGKAACETAQAARAAQSLARMHTEGDAARARAERQTQQNAAEDRKAEETVRYVTLRSQALPDGAAICIPADVADRLRGLD